jgi:sugar phosphate isomerase/epimerase
VVTFADDALMFFGMVRLAQIVDEVAEARTRAVELAVARERLQAPRSLQSAFGKRLADISSMATAAQRLIGRDPAQAQAQITAAGVAAREMVARARTVVVNRRSPSRPGPADTATSVAIGARLAWVVVVVGVLAYTAQGLSNILSDRDDARAAAEIGEMSRLCAAARADIRLVTGDGEALSLAGELADATQILASAGIEVCGRIPERGSRRQRMRCWHQSCVRRSPISCVTLLRRRAR